MGRVKQVKPSKYSKQRNTKKDNKLLSWPLGLIMFAGLIALIVFIAENLYVNFLFEIILNTAIAVGLIFVNKYLIGLAKAYWGTRLREVIATIILPTIFIPTMLGMFYYAGGHYVDAFRWISGNTKTVEGTVWNKYTKDVVKGMDTQHISLESGNYQIIGIRDIDIGDEVTIEYLPFTDLVVYLENKSK